MLSCEATGSSSEELQQPTLAGICLAQEVGAWSVAVTTPPQQAGLFSACSWEDGALAHPEPHSWTGVPPVPTPQAG